MVVEMYVLPPSLLDSFFFILKRMPYVGLSVTRVPLLLERVGGEEGCFSTAD